MLKAILRKLLNRIIGRGTAYLNYRLGQVEKNLENLNLQKLNESYVGFHSYKEFLRGKEAKVSSQNGEDGLIAYIFSTIGVTNMRFIEIACGNGVECNTAHLSINEGWRGLLIDADENNVRIARNFYRSQQGILPSQVEITCAWVTAENVNVVLKRSDFSGPIDLLSIDIDGNDYWLWRAIKEVDPRVVVIEYNASLGLRPLTVKYDPMFMRYKKHGSGYYHGASLEALTQLGKSKGYALVACESSGVNAFYVKRNLLKKSGLKEMRSVDAYYPLWRRCLKENTEKQFNRVKDMPWVEVVPKK